MGLFGFVLPIGFVFYSLQERRPVSGELAIVTHQHHTRVDAMQKRWVEHLLTRLELEAEGTRAKV